jgi:hypothetical protein
MPGYFYKRCRRYAAYSFIAGKPKKKKDSKIQIREDFQAQLMAIYEMQNELSNEEKKLFCLRRQNL